MRGRDGGRSGTRGTVGRREQRDRGAMGRGHTWTAPLKHSPLRLFCLHLIALLKSRQNRSEQDTDVEHDQFHVLGVEWCALLLN